MFTQIRDTNTQNSIERKFREITDKFQYLRELVQNSVEAGAGVVRVMAEPEAWRRYGVQRLMVLDNGSGMSAVTIKKVCDLNASMKQTGGEHDNFGVGAKITCLPFNPHGLVILSWTASNPKGSMIRLKRVDGMGYGSDDAEVVGYDAEGGEIRVDGDHVFEPTYLVDLGVDWSRTLESAKGELRSRGGSDKSGTLVVLCGNHMFDNTLLKAADGSYVTEVDRAAYLNQRYWDFPKGLSISISQSPVLERARATRFLEWENSQARKDVREDMYDLMVKRPDLSFEGEFGTKSEESFESKWLGIERVFGSSSFGSGLKSYLRNFIAEFATSANGRSVRVNTTDGVVGLRKAFEVLCAESQTGRKGMGVMKDPKTSAVISWFVQDPAKVSITTTPLTAFEKAGMTAVLYKGEIYNKNSGGVNLENWGIPNLTYRKTRLQDLIRIIVEYPHADKGRQVEGVFPNEARTELKWQAYKKDGDPHELSRLPSPADFFKENLPSNIKRVISDFEKLLDDKKFDLSAIRKKLSPILTNLMQYSAQSNELAEISCREPRVGSSSEGRPAPTDISVSPISTSHRPRPATPNPKYNQNPNCLWRKHGNPDLLGDQYFDFSLEGVEYPTGAYIYNSDGGSVFLNENFVLFRNFVKHFETYAVDSDDARAKVLDYSKRIFAEKVAAAILAINSCRVSGLLNKDLLSTPQSLAQHFLAVHLEMDRMESLFTRGELRSIRKST